jgi:hypothetical protein
MDGHWAGAICPVCRQRYRTSSTKTVPGVAVGFTEYLTLVEIEPFDPRDNLNSESARRKFPSFAS